MALVAVAACRTTPAEIVTPHDAAPPPPASASAAAPSASASLDAQAPDAEAPEETGLPDGGAVMLAAFCQSAYGADLDSMRGKCTEAELKMPASLSRAAARLCTGDLTSLVARGRVTFDEAGAQRCVASLRATPREKASETDTFFGHAPCDKLVAGKQGDGAPCRASVECKDGLACIGYKSTADGACRKPPKAGEACTPQLFGSIFNEAAVAPRHPACARGAFCAIRACAPRVAAGKDCTSTESCAEGLSCVMGTCARVRSAPGGSCRRQEDCVYGLFCERASNAKDGACRSKRAAGQACQSVDECKGSCDIPPGQREGSCVSVCSSG